MGDDRDELIEKLERYELAMGQAINVRAQEHDGGMHYGPASTCEVCILRAALSEPSQGEPRCPGCGGHRDRPGARLQPPDCSHPFHAASQGDAVQESRHGVTGKLMSEKRDTSEPQGEPNQKEQTDG